MWTWQHHFHTRSAVNGHIRFHSHISGTRVHFEVSYPELQTDGNWPQANPQTLRNSEYSRTAADAFLRNQETARNQHQLDTQNERNRQMHISYAQRDDETYLRMRNARNDRTHITETDWRNYRSSQTEQHQQYSNPQNVISTQDSRTQAEPIQQQLDTQNERNWQIPNNFVTRRNYSTSQTEQNPQYLNPLNDISHRNSSTQAEPTGQYRNAAFANVNQHSVGATYSAQQLHSARSGRIHGNLNFRRQIKDKNQRRVKRFPRIEVPQAELSEMICSICFRNAEEFKRKMLPVAKTICGHFFCVRCLWQWKKTKRTCPVCRQNVLHQGGCVVSLII